MASTGSNIALLGAALQGSALGVNKKNSAADESTGSGEFLSIITSKAGQAQVADKNADDAKVAKVKPMALDEAVGREHDQADDFAQTAEVMQNVLPLMAVMEAAPRADETNTQPPADALAPIATCSADVVAEAPATMSGPSIAPVAELSAAAPATVPAAQAAAAKAADAALEPIAAPIVRASDSSISPKVVTPDDAGAPATNTLSGAAAAAAVQQIGAANDEPAPIEPPSPAPIEPALAERLSSADAMVSASSQTTPADASASATGAPAGMHEFLQRLANQYGAATQTDGKPAAKDPGPTSLHLPGAKSSPRSASVAGPQEHRLEQPSRGERLGVAGGRSKEGHLRLAKSNAAMYVMTGPKSKPADPSEHSGVIHVPIAQADATASSAMNVPPSLPAAAPQPAAPLSNQIAGALAGAAIGNDSMQIRLDPPELGRVHLAFRSEGGEVRGLVQVDNPRTLADLQREAPALLNRLQDSGVQVKSMEFVLANNGGGNSSAMNQQAWHDSWRQDAAPGQEAGNADVAARKAANKQANEQTSPAGSGALNIWI